MANKIELFKGIVELAKAGYSVSDVKDILETLSTNPELPDSASALNNENLSDEDKSVNKAENEAKAEIDAIQAIIERNNKGE